MRTASQVVLLVALLGLPRPARADYYGWQALPSDVVGHVLLVGTPLDLFSRAGKGQIPLLLAGGAVGILGGPIVHFAHGYWEKGLGSLGLRIGIPLTLGLLGGELSRKRGSSLWSGLRWIGWAFLGAMIGLVAAQVLDHVLLAREPDASAAVAQPLRFQLTLAHGF